MSLLLQTGPSCVLPPLATPGRVKASIQHHVPQAHSTLHTSHIFSRLSLGTYLVDWKLQVVYSTWHGPDHCTLVFVQ